MSAPAPIPARRSSVPREEQARIKMPTWPSAIKYLFTQASTVCDLTTTSDPNSDDYGAADGILDASDFFFYLDLFAAGCP